MKSNNKEVMLLHPKLYEWIDVLPLDRKELIMTYIARHETAINQVPSMWHGYPKVKGPMTLIEVLFTDGTHHFEAVNNTALDIPLGAYTKFAILNAVTDTMTAEPEYIHVREYVDAEYIGKYMDL